MNATAAATRYPVSCPPVDRDTVGLQRLKNMQPGVVSSRFAPAGHHLPTEETHMLEKQLLVKDSTNLDNFLENFREMVRVKFGSHRKELGLSREQIATFFRVNVSTVRKWECGCTGRCQERHAMRMFRFLKGDYDRELTETIITPLRLNEAMKNIPAELHEILLRAIRIYPLLSNDTKLQQLFLQRLRLVNSEVLERAVQAGR